MYEGAKNRYVEHPGTTDSGYTYILTYVVHGSLIIDIGCICGRSLFDRRLAGNLRGWS
jgi:hypothetical protein